MIFLFAVAAVLLIAAYAGPTVTYNTAGNILATSTSISASGTSTGNIVDFSSACFGGWLEAVDTGGGTVAATNGLRVDVYALGNSASSYSTTPMTTFTITTVTSTVKRQAILLPTGKYSVTLTNLDATNAITAGLTSNPIS